jgi:hypothetical protein
LASVLDASAIGKFAKSPLYVAGFGGLDLGMA